MGKVVHCIHRQELSTAYAYEREDHPTCKRSPIFVFLQPLLVSSTLEPFRILWLFLLQTLPDKGSYIYIYIYISYTSAKNVFINFFLEEFHRSLQHFVVIIIYGLLLNNRKANQFRLLLILGKSDLLKSIFEMDTISEELIIVAS